MLVLLDSYTIFAFVSVLIGNLFPKADDGVNLDDDELDLSSSFEL